MTDNPYEPPAERTWSEPSLTDEQEKGRRILLVHIGLLLAISLIAILMFVLWLGTERFMGQVVRFALTVALCRWVYQGSVAAVRIAIALFGLGGVLGVIAVVAGPSFLGLVPMAILAAVAAVNLSFAFVLLASPSVDAFYNYQLLRKQQASRHAD